VRGKIDPRKYSGGGPSRERVGSHSEDEQGERNVPTREQRKPKALGPVRNRRHSKRHLKERIKTNSCRRPIRNALMPIKGREGNRRKFRAGGAKARGDQLCKGKKSNPGEGEAAGLGENWLTIKDVWRRNSRKRATSRATLWDERYVIGCTIIKKGKVTKTHKSKVIRGKEKAANENRTGKRRKELGKIEEVVWGGTAGNASTMEGDEPQAAFETREIQGRLYPFAWG